MYGLYPPVRHQEFDRISERGTSDTTWLYLLLIVVLFGLGIIIGHGI